MLNIKKFHFLIFFPRNTKTYLSNNNVLSLFQVLLLFSTTKVLTLFHEINVLFKFAKLYPTVGTFVRIQTDNFNEKRSLIFIKLPHILVAVKLKKKLII